MLERIQKIKKDLEDWYSPLNGRPWLFDKIETYYYNTKYTILNYIKYAKIISRHRTWDSEYILEMMQFQLKDLCNTIEKYGNEIDEERLPKIENMKRAIEILENQLKHKYLEKCGYIAEATEFKFNKTKDDEFTELTIEKVPGYENYDEHKVFVEADKLETQEWNELFDLLKDMKGWWD